MQNTLAFQIAHHKQRKKRPSKHQGFNPFQMHSNHKGQKAENTAKTLLENNGLIFLCKNIACPLGELDLVMKDQNTLVIIEVRQRTQKHHGLAIETIGKHKQNNIIKTFHVLFPHIIQHFFNGQAPDYRFDLITIDKNHVSWIKNFIFINE
ncbi:MAG: YraN family protein [Alcaligenaceae bacterium]|nr:YraN family protein [Alcaligenaceae bacterium]